MRWCLLIFLMLLPSVAVASMLDEPLISEEKLDLLKSQSLISADQIFTADPEQTLRDVYKCGGMEGLNSYISSLYGRKEIHYAAVHGDVLRVKQLLLEGENISARDARGATPLIISASNGMLEMVKLLLAEGADPLLTDGGGYTAFDHALIYAWPEVVEVLRPYKDAHDAEVAKSASH